MEKNRRKNILFFNIFGYFLLLFKDKFDIIDKNEPIFERIFANGNFIFCFCLFHVACHS